MSIGEDAGAILAELVRAESVTPHAGAALDILARHLGAAGFSVERPVFAAPGTEPVENLFAAIGRGERHLMLAGHADVVPPGTTEQWRHPPFAAAVEDGILYGRGAVDMKGGLAAMLAAALGFVQRRGADFDGRLSFLVTGDEEGPAINGTAELLAWAAARGERFSAALLGEPTSAHMLGDQVKIGRRGSFSATLRVEGRQGHVAYPDLADNPIRGLTQLLYALQTAPIDDGSEAFGPSTLEIVRLDVDNAAWNVIPGAAAARLNCRFNDRWTVATLRAEIERRLAAAAIDRTLGVRQPVRWSLAPEPGAAEPFLTHDPALIDTLADAIERVTGQRPALSTSGGTSDARFIRAACPVIEFGPVGATMHQIDERVPLAEIDALTRIYSAFLEAFYPA
jgi:succinyl-diaminopimelate desuccinylase